jgi:hypothetical protein
MQVILDNFTSVRDVKQFNECREARKEWANKHINEIMQVRHIGDIGNPLPKDTNMSKSDYLEETLKSQQRREQLQAKLDQITKNNAGVPKKFLKRDAQSSQNPASTHQSMHTSCGCLWGDSNVLDQSSTQLKGTAKLFRMQVAAAQQKARLVSKRPQSTMNKAKLSQAITRPISASQWDFSNVLEKRVKVIHNMERTAAIAGESFMINNPSRQSFTNLSDALSPKSGVVISRPQSPTNDRFIRGIQEKLGKLRTSLACTRPVPPPVNWIKAQVQHIQQKLYSPFRSSHPQ